MSTSDHKPATLPTYAGAQFATTHWSVILAAGHDSSPGAREALERLCRTYWYPLYAYVRRNGFGIEDAQDLTQEFLLHLIERASISTVEPEKGRFRSFLLAALKYFLANERDKASTRKRGGDLRRIDWDGLTAEQRYVLEPAVPAEAQQLYDRRWAITLLDRAVSRLEAEHRIARKEKLFAELHGCLLGGYKELAYEAVGQRLGMTAGAVKTAVHRMRRRFQELIREEVGQTVAMPNEVEDELQYLCSVITG